MSTTIVFRGLCTFIDRGTTYEVCLLPDPHVGHGGRRHLPTLAVPIAHVDTDPATSTWEPTAITYERTGGSQTQLGVWRLADGSTIEPTPEGSTSDTLPVWPDRAAAIDLRRHHEADGARARSTGELLRRGAVVIVLRGGDLQTLEPIDNPEVKRKGGGGPVQPRFSQAIAWTAPGSRLDLVSGGRRIALHDGAEVTISNIAPVPAEEGIAHFAHYYDVFLRQPAEERRLVLEFAPPDPTKIVPLDVTVYDCVPPAPGPDPEP